MPVMTSQILKSVDFTETQKPRLSRESFFFLQIKKLNCTQKLRTQGLLYSEK